MLRPIFDLMHEAIKKCFDNRYNVTPSQNKEHYDFNTSDPETSVIFLDIESYGIKTVSMIRQLRNEYPKKESLHFQYTTYRLTRKKSMCIGGLSDFIL